MRRILAATLIGCMCVAAAVAGQPAVAAGPDSYTRQLLLPDDFSYAGRSERATWDSASGTWRVADDLGSTHQLGASGDIPTVTNDGDGFARIGVFRPSNGTWYLANDKGKLSKTIHYGVRGDIPVAAHYNGIDEPSVVALFRPSNGVWYAAGLGSVQFGAPGDVPVPGHYDGTADTDYTDAPAVFRPSTGVWYSETFAHLRYGQAGDVPVPADYNGDGRTDIAVYRPSTGTWYIRGSTPVVYGVRGDIPVTGDFNGDGKADLAIYRRSDHTWHVRGQASVSFGSTSSTVVPIGAAPYTD